jgi:hypothetical protein
MDALLNGPLFSTSDNWLGDNTNIDNDISYAPIFKDFSVNGDITVAQEQDAYIAYDRLDHAEISNLIGNYIWGRMFGTGIELNKQNSYMRESHFTNLWCQHCGNPSVAVFDVNTADTLGGSDSTNTNEFTNLMAWDVGGPCLSIRNDGSASHKPTTVLNFHGGRCEGGIPTVSQDLVKIGSPTSTGQVTDINMDSFNIIATNFGSAGLKLDGASLTVAPFAVSIAKMSIQGSGKGVDIEAGSQIRLDINNISTTDTKLTVASSSKVASPIVITGNGSQASWTTNIDSTSYSAVFDTIYRSFAPPGGVGFITTTAPDGSIANGNVPAQGTVDLQAPGGRTSASQVAAATNSTIGGGRRIQINAGGIGATVPGGTDVTVNGPNTQASGTQCQDNSVTSDIWCSGSIHVAGDTNIGMYHFHNTTTGTNTIRLTSDNSASGGIANCGAIPDNSSLGFIAVMTGFNANTPTDRYSWSTPLGVLSRQSGVATTGVSVATPTIKQDGTGGAAASFTLGADTTNGCFDPEFTGGSAGTWDITLAIFKAFSK